MSEGAQKLSCICHGGDGGGALASGWNLDPWVVVPLALGAGLYAVGAVRLWSRAGFFRGLRAFEAAAYLGFLLSMVVALLSPLDALSDVLFSAHMSQHELLMLVAAPLFVLGKPLMVYLWALPEALRGRFGQTRVGPGWLRTLTHPVGVLVLHAVVLWVWHIPSLFEAALRSEAVHAFQHTGFFVTAALFFWALVHGRYGRTGYGVAVLYVFVTALHTSILGALMTVARTVWYPLQGVHTAQWGLSGLEDQQLAGLIMWVPSGVLLMLVGLALFAAWMGEAQRRSERLSRR